MVEIDMPKEEILEMISEIPHDILQMYLPETNEIKGCWY